MTTAELSPSYPSLAALAIFQQTEKWS